jgi:hypothetical protein
MERVTLRDLFAELNGKHFETRMAFEAAVVEVFNRHLAQLPVGYSYKDAIEGARVEGWLETNGDGHGVSIRVPGPVPA